MDYKFSKNTFPVNKLIEQHNGVINNDDALFELTLLAGEILGVECNDTVMAGDRTKDFDITYYQITPDSYRATDGEARKNYEAFTNYFYANYGKHKDRCYFDTVHEAFFNIVKAWKIWENILDETEKGKYRY